MSLLLYHYTPFVITFDPIVCKWHLVWRVLDDDRSGYLGFKEFLQAIDLMGARWGLMASNGPLPITHNHRYHHDHHTHQPHRYHHNRTPDDKLRWTFKMYDEDNQENHHNHHNNWNHHHHHHRYHHNRTPDDKLRWAFKMYDEDNSREVDHQEMENVMVVSCFRWGLRSVVMMILWMVRWL